MSFYECVLIARQDISSQQVDQLVDEVEGILTENGGKVEKREPWGLRNLSFRVKKNRKGHYVLLNIDAPAPAIAEMERRIRFNEDVIRHLTVRVDELDPEPSAILAKDKPGPRGRREGGR